MSETTDRIEAVQSIFAVLTIGTGFTRRAFIPGAPTGVIIVAFMGGAGDGAEE